VVRPFPYSFAFQSNRFSTKLGGKIVAEGFILMGGPLVDEGGSLLIFNAEDENEVREKMKNDPWLKQGILKQESIKRWQIFIDERK
jgi:uncharacterized protein YciI